MKLNVHSLSAFLFALMGGGTIATTFATHSTPVAIVGGLCTLVFGASYLSTVEKIEAQAKTLQVNVYHQGDHVAEDAISEIRGYIAQDAQTVVQDVKEDAASLAPQEAAPGASPVTDQPTQHLPAITGNAA